MPTRRHFLQQMGTAALAAGLGIHASRLVRAAVSTTDWPIAIFEKVLEGLSYEELADAIARAISRVPSGRRDLPNAVLKRPQVLL